METRKFGILLCCATLLLMGPSVVAGPWTTVRLTDNAYDDRFAFVSGTNATWFGADAGDDEIFFRKGLANIKVTDNNRTDNWPNISGSRAVWWGHDGSNYQIFVYDSEANTTVQITHNTSFNRDALIAGSNIVWSGGGIWLYDGISSRQLKSSGSYPVVSNTHVGWVGGGVWLYDIEANTARQLATSGDSAHLSGGNVVWHTSGGRISLYRSDANLTIDLGPGIHPDISGTNVVWEKDDEIYLYDGNDTRRLTTNSLLDSNPWVYGNRVVWEENDGNDWEIYVWDNGQTIRLTDNNYDDDWPKISESAVVWEGYDGHDWEIYMAVPEPCSVAVLGLLGVWVVARRRRMR